MIISFDVDKADKASDTFKERYISTASLSLHSRFTFWTERMPFLISTPVSLVSKQQNLNPKTGPAMAIGEISEPLNNSANSQYFLCGSKVKITSLKPFRIWSGVCACVCAPITEGASWVRGGTAVRALLWQNRSTGGQCCHRMCCCCSLVKVWMKHDVLPCPQHFWISPVWFDRLFCRHVVIPVTIWFVIASMCQLMIDSMIVSCTVKSRRLFIPCSTEQQYQQCNMIECWWPIFRRLIGLWGS